MTTGVPISTLPTATLPLGGGELAVVVQGGTTKQTTVTALGGFGLVKLSALATVAIAAGANANVAVTDIELSNRVYVFPAGDAEVSGFVPSTTQDGQLMLFINFSAFLLTLLSESALSLAANRLVSNGDIILPPNCGALYVRDTGLQRWVKT